MRRHETNLTALVAGLVFLGIGIYGMAVTPTHLADNLRWLWPVLLIGLGVALLLRPSRSRREDSTSDEVGPERGEDGEVEEAGGGHDGGVGAFAERGPGDDRQHDGGDSARDPEPSE
jgi:hypothetical protein